MNGHSNKEINIFANFFILRTLWKKESIRPVSELYLTHEKLLNKSFYDNIMRVATIDKNIVAMSEKKAGKISDVIGIDKGFFTGEKLIQIEDQTAGNWREFIQSQGKKTEGYKRAIIESKIQKVASDLDKQSDEFKALLYWVKHGKKRYSDKAKNNISDIELLINQIRKEDVLSLSPSELKKHMEFISTYSQRLLSLCIYNDWK